ncbi:type IV pilus modification PilV family protein [Maioricimonas rarisocia]|uniref:type IV pilus modification PilV family protein n=1 Tax=Maioricimonas rarisocia TaxID=2528026 RepID=UPI0011AAF36B|nr:hypothetical protein [Maioricimonas rarisocia]
MPVARDGATLTEVLISILVMSVGVLSVMAMFPISILRSIQATQLTNAAILRENVRQQIALFPQFVLGGSEWRPNATYTMDEFVVPSIKPGHRFPANRRLIQTNAGGTSGWIEPDWSASTPISDGSVTWDTVVAPSAYVVDPLGWKAMEDALGTGLGGGFGNFDDSGTVREGSLLRLNAGITDFDIAAAAVALPDSWSIVIDAVPTSMTLTSATFGSNVNMGTFSTSTSAPTRVVVTSFDGTQSVVRTSSVSVSTNTVSWSGDLPTALDSINKISRVRVETFERRYTWLITARRGPSGHTKAQCVILFNRSLNPNDEYLYEVTSVGGSSIAGSNTLTVRWQASEPDPLIREGNFVFDAENALWYRIQAIDSIDRISSPRTATLTLGRQIEIDFATGASARGGAMFLPGIIDIFEL